MEPDESTWIYMDRGGAPARISCQALTDRIRETCQEMVGWLDDFATSDAEMLAWQTNEVVACLNRMNHLVGSLISKTIKEVCDVGTNNS